MDELEPSEFFLAQNYPNPFKEKTIIKYCVAFKTRVQLTVYNSEGKVIGKLVDEVKLPGTYEAVFQLVEGNRQSAREDYYYRLEAGDYSSEKKMEIEK